jgi:hypothetical protein
MNISSNDFLSGFMGFCMRSGFSKEAATLIYQRFARSELAPIFEGYVDMVKSGAFASFNTGPQLQAVDPNLNKNYQNAQNYLNDKTKNMGATERAQAEEESQRGLMTADERRGYNKSILSGDNNANESFANNWWRAAGDVTGLSGGLNALNRGAIGAKNWIQNTGNAGAQWTANLYGDKTNSMKDLWGTPTDMSTVKDTSFLGGANRNPNMINNERAQHQEAAKRYQALHGISPEESERMSNQLQQTGGRDPVAYNKWLEQRNSGQGGWSGNYGGYGGGGFGGNGYWPGGMMPPSMSMAMPSAQFYDSATVRM